MESHIVIKINCADELRRVSVPTHLSLENFVVLIKTMFKNIQNPKIHYFDGEDNIRVVTELDWCSAIEFSLSEKVLRIFVSESSDAVDIENETSSSQVLNSTPLKPKKELFSGPDVYNYNSTDNVVSWFSTAAFVENPVKVIFTFKWSDQGWGNRKGEIKVNLYRNGRFHNTKTLGNFTAPHEVTHEKLVYKDNQLFPNILAGDSFQFQYVVGGGGGHGLVINDFQVHVFYTNEENEEEQEISSSSENNNESSNEQQQQHEEDNDPEDPTLSIFAGKYRVWDRKSYATSWTSLESEFEITRSGKLFYNNKKIIDFLVIPDGESVSIGWNFNENNDFQGEITVSFGGVRGYYWDEELSTEMITFDGWIQQLNDTKVDFKGALINLLSWEYLSLIPDNNAVQSSENSNNNNEGEQAVEEEEDDVDDYLQYISEIKESLLAFESFMRRDKLAWENDHQRDQWIEKVKAESSSASDIGLLMIEFVSKISASVLSGWVNGEHYEHSARLKSPHLKTSDLARILLSIEISISWDGVIDEFKEARSSWVNSLNTFPKALSLKDLISPESSLDTFKSSLSSFYSYIRDDCMNWDSVDQKYTWLTAVSLIDSAPDAALLLLQFIDSLNASILSENWKSSYAAIAQQLSNSSTITSYDLASILLNLEISISWSGVIDEFREKRKEWKDILMKLSDYGTEVKLAALGDLSSTSVGLQLLCNSLLRFESFMKREAMNWYLDVERNIWIEDLQLIINQQSQNHHHLNNEVLNCKQSIARLFVKFISKIKENYISNNWQNGFHPIHSPVLTKSSVSIEEIASILLAIEISIPWSSVIDEFRLARDEWRESLVQLVNIRRKQTPFKSVLFVLRNSLIALENFMMRKTMNWNSADHRKSWKTEVLNAQSLACFSRLIAQFISNIKRDQSVIADPQLFDDLQEKLTSNAEKIKIQTLLQSLTTLEQNIPWSCVTPAFQSNRSSWLETITSLPQYTWIDDGFFESDDDKNEADNDDDEFGAPQLSMNNNQPQHAASVAMRSSSMIRSSVRNVIAAKKNGMINYNNANPKSTLELISSGIFKAYSLHTTLQENDKINAKFLIQSFPNEELEFEMNFISFDNQLLWKIAFIQKANKKGVIKCFVPDCNNNNELIAVSDSSAWVDSFPFSPSQDFECTVIPQTDSEVKVVFDGVFTIPSIHLPSQSISEIKRVCLAGKSGRVLCKNIQFDFSRSVSLIPE